MPPTDPTPTPREVLDAVLASPNGRAIAAMYGPEFTGRTLPSLVQEILAALAATGDAPLAGDELAAIRRKANNPALFEGEVVIAAFHRLLTAYTTLAAQCAAARAERDELKERVKVAEGRLADYERDAQAQTVVRPTDTPPGVADYEQMLRATRPTDTGRVG